MARRTSTEENAASRPRGATASRVVDFQTPHNAASRSRSRTMPLQRVPGSPASLRSPDPRRSSILSRWSSNDDHDGMRRRPTRADTVKTYYEPDHHQPNWQPGAEPGIDTSNENDDLPHLLALKAPCVINIIDFSEDDVIVKQASNDNVGRLLDEERPDGYPCRWISVNGLSWDVIKCIGKKFELHSLAIEDLINTHSRTKVDWYRDHACIVLTLQKLVLLHQHGDHEDCPASDDHDHHKSIPAQASKRWWQRSKRRDSDALPYYLDRNGDGQVDEKIKAHSGISEDSPVKKIRTLHRYESSQIPEHTAFMEKHSVLADEDLVVSVEQVCIFLMSDNTVISFFEHSAEDVESPIMARLYSTETILRRTVDASLMAQAIIDAVVDLALPVKDAYNKARKELQVDAMTNPNIRTSRALHIFGEEIDMLQNLFKPIVHLVNALRDHNGEPPSQPPAESMSQPPEPQTTKRDREGMPMMHRKMSDFRRTTLRRAQTVTNVVISPLAHTYFGDVLDHCISTIQAFEQMDASANNISTLIFNTVGARTNSFMMILAVVTVFFAPLTFVSGYFGMNFAKGDGLAHPFSFFWIVAVPSLVGFMLLVFATMLWDNIRNFLAKRGIKAHKRHHGRRHIP